jgi:hypothetical protein
MSEITYLPEVECVISNPNAMLNTQIVYVQDEKQNKQFLRVGKGMVQTSGNKTYLGVGIVDLDYKNGRALIELPLEADSGTRRLWVPFERFRPQKEAS